MSAYLILTQTVTDPDSYMNAYIPGVMPFLQKYSVEVLAAEFAAESVQGDPPDSVIVLRFPSKEAIREFLDDPDYQPVKAIRMAATTNGNAVIAAQFEMPEQ